MIPELLTYFRFLWHFCTIIVQLKLFNWVDGVRVKKKIHFPEGFIDAHT